MDGFTLIGLLAVLAVVAVLVLGLGTFGIGGKLNKQHGNRLMRYRLYAQAAAVAVILLLVFLKSRQG